MRKRKEAAERGQQAIARLREQEENERQKQVNANPSSFCLASFGILLLQLTDGLLAAAGNPGQDCQAGRGEAKEDGRRGTGGKGRKGRSPQGQGQKGS